MNDPHNLSSSSSLFFVTPSLSIIIYSTMNREVSHYVVTAHPSGGVLHSVKCNFLARDSEVRLLYFVICCHQESDDLLTQRPIVSSFVDVEFYGPNQNKPNPNAVVSSFGSN